MDGKTAVNEPEKTYPFPMTAEEIALVFVAIAVLVDRQNDSSTGLPFTDKVYQAAREETRALKSIHRKLSGLVREHDIPVSPEGF